MDVNVGYFSDPDGLEGLAHFLGQSICKFLSVLMHECTCSLYMNGWICVCMYRCICLFEPTSLYNHIHMMFHFRKTSINMSSYFLCMCVYLYMTLQKQQLCAITFTWFLLMFRFHQTSINMSSYFVCMCVYLSLLTFGNYSIICVNSCCGFVLSCYKLTRYKFIVYIATQWVILASCFEHIVCFPCDIHPQNRHFAQSPTLVTCLWMLPMFATSIHHIKRTEYKSQIFFEMW